MSNFYHFAKWEAEKGYFRISERIFADIDIIWNMRHSVIGGYFCIDNYNTMVPGLICTDKKS